MNTSSSLQLVPLFGPQPEAWRRLNAHLFRSDESLRFYLRQHRERLLRAMIRLPDRLKLVLQLFFVEELNLTEIAAVFEVSIPRVHQLRAKALTDLRRLMEGDEAD